MSCALTSISYYVNVADDKYGDKDTLTKGTIWQSEKEKERI